MPSSTATLSACTVERDPPPAPRYRRLNTNQWWDAQTGRPVPTAGSGLALAVAEGAAVFGVAIEAPGADPVQDSDRVDLMAADPVIGVGPRNAGRPGNPPDPTGSGRPSGAGAGSDVGDGLLPSDHPEAEEAALADRAGMRSRESAGGVNRAVYRLRAAAAARAAAARDRAAGDQALLDRADRTWTPILRAIADVERLLSLSGRVIRDP